MTRRTAAILVSLLCTPLLAAAGPSRYKKAYFGVTKPGAWAQYTMSMPGFPDSPTTYTRLPDEGGQVRLQIRSDFTNDGQASTSFSDYKLKKGYSLEKDALSFGAAVVSLTVRTGKGEPTVMQPAVLENVRKTSPNYASAVKFVATETVDGKTCDRYKYTLKHAGNPVQIETGELWLNETVPFGLVRQRSVTKASGKVLTQYTMTLTDSGSGAKTAK